MVSATPNCRTPRPAFLKLIRGRVSLPVDDSSSAAKSRAVELRERRNFASEISLEVGFVMSASYMIIVDSVNSVYRVHMPNTKIFGPTPLSAAKLIGDMDF
jgi:hypothetical protein